MVKIKHIVIKPFNNLGAVVMPGDSVECDTGRASKLRRLGLIGGVVKEAEKKAGSGTFAVTYTDDSGKSITRAVEAASYQAAVDKVIKDLFAEPELDAAPKPIQTEKKVNPKDKSRAVK